MAKTEMNPKNREDGMLRLNLLKLLRENPNGLTISKIAETMKATRYKISKEIYNLAGLGELTIDKIGNYEVIKVK